jgi:hypothetical protein
MWVPHSSRSTWRDGWAPLQFAPPPRSPLRLDLNHTKLSRSEVPAAPPPIVLRFRSQTPDNRIPMHINQLLHPLLLRKHIEIVIPRQPKSRPVSLELLRSRPFENRDRFRDCSVTRLTHQQMNMFRHKHIPGNPEVVISANVLQRRFKNLHRMRFEQERLAIRATPGKEVEVPCFLIAAESGGHGGDEILARPPIAPSAAR